MVFSISSKSGFIPCIAKPLTSSSSRSSAWVCGSPSTKTSIPKACTRSIYPRMVSTVTGLQSPIDIPNNGTVSVPVRNAPEITEGRMVLTRSELTSNGNFEMHVENVGFPGTVKFKDITYELDQFHIHNLSEHTIDGRQYPIEMHLVHKRGENETCVVAIFFDFGAHNDEFDKVLDAMQKEGSQSDVSVVKLLGAGLNTLQLLTTEGSFTTPPFTPGVQWIVSKEIPHVSREQVRRYQNTPHVVVPNNRDIQDTQNRRITAYF